MKGSFPEGGGNKEEHSSSAEESTQHLCSRTCHRDLKVVGECRCPGVQGRDRQAVREGAGSGPMSQGFAFILGAMGSLRGF